MKKVLFVCLGNICRSPAAEGVMRSMVREAKLEDQIFCDSAGTSAYHHDETADPRMQKHAMKRGYKLTSLARPFDPTTDFADFDYIVTMDDSNYNNVIKTDPDGLHRSKVHKMVSFCSESLTREVPDPYTGGDEGFEEVMDIVEDGCRNLLIAIQKELKS